MQYFNFHTHTNIDLGDPFVSFRIEAKNEDGHAYLITSLHPFRSFLKINYPNEAQYITDIRNSMTGYGPKEDKVLAKMEEENFPLEKFVIAYFDARPNMIRTEMDREKAYKADPTIAQKLQEKSKSIFANMPLDFQFIAQGVMFDQLEQKISGHLVDQYPEILNGKPEDIIEFRDILLTHIPKLGSAVIDLVEKIRMR
jgi:hypothetical protein